MSTRWRHWGPNYDPTRPSAVKTHSLLFSKLGLCCVRINLSGRVIAEKTKQTKLWGEKTSLRFQEILNFVQFFMVIKTGSFLSKKWASFYWVSAHANEKIIEKSAWANFQTLLVIILKNVRKQNFWSFTFKNRHSWIKLCWFFSFYPL